MTCLITGCNLVDLHNNRWVHGDLHKIGHNYVFNACVHMHEDSGDVGEAAWNHGSKPAADSKQIELDITSLRDNQFFERRGVITFPAIWGRLNEVALAYLGRLPV